jgi:hypothetical protein
MKDLDSRSGESKIKNGERNGFLTRTSVLLSALVLPIKWRHSGQQPNKKNNKKKKKRRKIGINWSSPERKRVELPPIIKSGERKVANTKMVAQVG